MGSFPEAARDRDLRRSVNGVKEQFRTEGRDGPPQGQSKLTRVRVAHQILSAMAGRPEQRAVGDGGPRGRAHAPQERRTQGAGLTG